MRNIKFRKDKHRSSNKINLNININLDSSPFLKEIYYNQKRSREDDFNYNNLNKRTRSKIQIL